MEPYGTYHKLFPLTLELRKLQKNFNGNTAIEANLYWLQSLDAIRSTLSVNFRS